MKKITETLSKGCLTEIYDLENACTILYNNGMGKSEAFKILKKRISFLHFIK